MPNHNRQKIEQWKLSRLRPHPRQALTFSAPSEEKLTELMDDLRRNGLREPLTVLANGTIIRGHTRAEVARRLGWTTIAVTVRYDLSDDDAAAERELIEDNLNRRHLSKLEQARAYLRLKELASSSYSSSLSHYDMEKLRDRIGKLDGNKRRNIDRYLAILRTPMAVQDAFDRGDLNLVQGAKVATLEPDDQAEIAAAIDAGRDPKQVFTEYVTRRASPKTLLTVYFALLRSLQNAQSGLQGQTHRLDLPVSDSADRVQALDAGIRLLAKLKRRETQSAADFSTFKESLVAAKNGKFKGS